MHSFKAVRCHWEFGHEKENIQSSSYLFIPCLKCGVWSLFSWNSVLLVSARCFFDLGLRCLFLFYILSVVDHVISFTLRQRFDGFINAIGVNWVWWLQILETAFKKETVGLVTREQYVEKVIRSQFIIIIFFFCNVNMLCSHIKIWLNFAIEGQYSEQDRRGREREAPKVATRVGGF